jgi:hypothetical protein
MDSIRSIAPSVFADQPHESRSSRYTYIPTSTVVEGLMANDFLPVRATQSSSRIEGKSEFTKHMLRFRHASAQDVAVGDSVPELVVINSHDGTSAYKLMGGIFRLVCLNGMVVADSMCGSISVRHTGNVVDDVIEGSFSVMQGVTRALDVSQDWQALRLSAPEQQVFAEAAHELRFADSDGKIDTPIQAAQMLRARRNEDRADDLWHTFNRVQENAIRGGLSAHAGREHDYRRVTTRPVKGIDQDVRLNRALWTLAEKMAQLKTA